MSCKCAIRFWNFSFLPQGSIKGPKMTFWWSCCHWTLSTFHRIDNWYYRIWLGKSCRFQNFHFIPMGQMRVEKRHFSFLQSLSLNYIYIFKSRQLILWDLIRHVLQMCSKDSEFSFPHWGHIRVEQWRFLSYKARLLNSIYISKCRQMIL